MQFPLLDLKAQYAAIRDEVAQAIDKVCESQFFALGPLPLSPVKKIIVFSRKPI